MSAEYRVEIKVKNNNILKRIEDAGYKTVGEFCRLNEEMKSQNSSLGDIINMKKSPLQANGEFISCIRNAADILCCSPEDFFTDIQLHAAIASNRRTLEVNEAEMKFLMSNAPEQKFLEDFVMEDEKSAAINELIETLTPREAKIIKERFGLNGEEAKTLAEVASKFDITPARIRQIEAKALRKLRHPSRREIVREFI